MAKQVDATYGNALFELAVELNKIDELYNETIALTDILRDEEELIKFLNHPHISKEEKAKVVKETFDGRCSDELAGLMDMVVRKNHAASLVAIFEYFIKLVKEEKKIGVVSITSAITLLDEQKSSIEKRILETTAYESLEAEYKVDKSLLGGLVIRIQDRVVDSSIKTKLDGLSKQLAKA